MINKFYVLVLMVFFVFSCKNEKSTWTDAQKQTWLQDCNATFVKNAVKQEDKAQLEDLCKCMLKVTSRDYTVEAAGKLTQDELRSQLEDCNYNF